MHLLKKSISVLLILVMMFSLLPAEYMQPVFADKQGVTGSIITPPGSNHISGGTLSTEKPVFRVMLSREKQDKLNGSQKYRDDLINYYQTTYPKSQDLRSATLFLWDSYLYSKRNKWSVGQYVNDGSGNIQVFNTPEYSNLNIKLSTGTQTENVFKTKVLNAKNQKIIGSISDLANNNWKNYLPTKDQALKSLSWIFQRVGNSYYVDDRIVKFCDAANFRSDPKTLNDDQKFSVATGYAGLLACFYVITADNPNLSAVSGNYATALNDYFANNNIDDKPVSLIIDTAISITVNRGSDLAPTAFPIASMEYIEMSTLASQSDSITLGSEFIKMQYPGAAGNTKEMVKAMAASSAKRHPWQTTFAGNKNSSLIRFIDRGGNQTNLEKNNPIGRIIYIPQFKNSCIRVSSSNEILNRTSKYSGFTDLITFDKNLKGFLVVGNHLANPIPKLTFTVKTNGYSTPDVCEREVHLLEPNVLTFEFKADSGLISSLDSRVESNDAVIELAFEIYRTKTVNDVEVEVRKRMEDLEKKLPNKLSKDEAKRLLQGETVKVDDEDIMTETYIREDGVNQTVKFEYDVNVTLTIDKQQYKYAGKDIVSTINGITANYATYNIRMYGDQVTLPPDIEIPKPSSTMTTEIVQPSENENLYDMTQMIRRYEYTSRGETFAETKHNYPLKEEYEVMGGVPSSEEIYFSVGGSEFQLAMVLQYWMNEHSRDRTYTMHFDENKCEYNNEIDGQGDRLMEWFPKAQPDPAIGGGHYNDVSIHCLNESGNGAGDWQIQATWTYYSTNHVPQYHSCPSCGKRIEDSCDFSGATEEYNQDLEAANKLAEELGGEIIVWHSGSDKETRETYWKPVVNPGSAPSDGTSPGNDGSPGCGGKHNACGGCFSGDPPTNNCDPGSPCDAGSVCPGHGWTITVTATIKPHEVCGPCCGHNMPDLWDTWRQGLVYDFVKISQIRLYKLDQGVADGFEELTGTDKYYANIVSGNPTYFHNIAQLTEIGYQNNGKIKVGEGLTAADPEKSGLTYYGGDQLRRIAQSSRDGRLRYILDPNMGTSPTFNFAEQGDGQGGSFTLDYNKVAAPEQHDDVIYTIGKRSANCDGMATTNNFGKSSSNNVIPMDNTGHSNEWADGCLYVNLLDHTNYDSYWNLGSFGKSYVPKEQIENDANAIGTMGNGWKSRYYEDYNHHIVRDGGADKSGYSDKADNKDTQTAEWKCFDAARRTKIIANVISDFIVLQTSGGDQSIFYYEKATPATEAQEHFQKLIITEKEIFDNNPLSIFNGVSEVCKNGANGNLKDEKMVDLIVVGGYNGQYNKPKDKYKPYSLVTHKFLPFGSWPTYDATKKTGAYEVYGGYAVKTILDNDPAKTISRPIREAKSQDTSFKILQDKIRILPTTANQIYEPGNARVWYHQELGYFSMDLGVLDAQTGEHYVGCADNVQIGYQQRVKFGDRYKEDWGTRIGVDYEAKYFITPDGDQSTGSINPVIVHTPVSTEFAMVLQQPDLIIEGTTISRDQRVDDYVYPDMNEVVNNLKVCPLDPGECEYRFLNCKYTEPTVLAEFDFSPTYETTEKQIVDGKLQTVNVTKKNTYQENGKWITTNTVTGVEYTLPSGFSIESAGRVGEGNYLRAQGSRWSLPFSTLGLANDKTNNVQINMDLTVESNNNNIMLIGFQNYGFILNSESGFIRANKDNNTELKNTKMVTKPNYHNVHLSLTFGFNSIIDAKATVNGKDVSVTRVTEVRNVWETVNGVRKLVKKNVVLNPNNFDKDAPEVLSRTDIGSNINIGSWGNSTNYTANFYLDNLQIVLLGGTTEHNSNCYETVTVHATGMTHTHTDECYAKEDMWTCNGELNANYQLNCNKPERELICGLTESGSGVYNLVRSDDDSGGSLEAYLSYNLTKGQSVKIQMGGYNGGSGSATLTVTGPNGFRFVSGQQSYSGYFEGSGSYKYEFAVLTSGTYTFSTSNRTNDPYLGLYVRDGHRHVPTCYRTHTHIGTPGLDYANGCYTKPTEHKHHTTATTVYTCNNLPLNAGGTPDTWAFRHTSGCTYAGETHYSTNSDRCSVCGHTCGGVTGSLIPGKPNDRHTHTSNCKTVTYSACTKIPKGSLVCTGELNTVTDYNVHKHTADCLTTAGAGTLPTVSFQATRNVQIYRVPWTDTYTIEVYGPGSGNRSGYAKAEVKLKAKDTLYVYVGDNNGYNSGMTDVRLVKVPSNLDIPGEEPIENQAAQNSLKSRMLYASSTSGTVIDKVGDYTLKRLETGIKGNTGGGRVVITPKNTVINPTILEQIINGTMPPDEAKDYLGDTLYDKIVKDSEKVLHTWSGWSTSNDKGFKALNQCSLTMNGNLVVKSTGNDPYFDVQLDNIPYQAITQIKVYLNNPVSNKGQIFLKDATGTYNEADSVWSNTVTVGVKNQIMTFDLRGNKNFSGNFKGLRFDLGSTTGTMTVTKIEVLGYGTKQAGSGEASYVNNEKVVATAGTKWNFNYTGNVQSKTLEKGKYKLEVWGAQGGGNEGGKGGYSYGNINLTSKSTLNIYVGGQGGLKSGGWNGGGTTNTAGYGGGGATDIRIGGTSLSSRIIVAGGGGGIGPRAGGAGGGGNNPGLRGTNGCGKAGYGGTLTAGGAGGGAGNGIAECGQAGTLGNGGKAWCTRWNPTGHGGGGGGGGYYGGGAGTHDDYYSRQDNDDSGGGGGSGYVNTSKFTSIGGSTGVRSGHGYATITALEDIKTGGIEYKFTPLKVAYRSPLEGSKDIINANIDSIPEYVNGDYNPIWVCKMQPKNAHVCEMLDEDGNIISLCRTVTNLNCNEPHHRGEHYTGSNDICWDACGKDENHKNTHKDVVDNNTGETLHLANFLQLDDGFTIYFPNRGNFAGDPTKLGLSNPTTQRCLGYTDNMDTTDWTREKRVKFPFDVIYEDMIYSANTWIDLDVPTEYFNFYLLVSNNEQANGSVEFECEAINCNSGVGMDVAPGVEYSKNINTDYAEALDKFLDGYLAIQVAEVNKGYQVPFARKGGNTGAEARPFGRTGYENFYIAKENKEKQMLDKKVFDLNKQIENEFEGGNEQNRYINPHTYSNKGINHDLKPITSNDNKIRVDNKMRMDSYQSLHGGYKHFYIDVIGRIGNLSIVDTEDFRFSNFFKLPIVSANDTEGLADAKNWLIEGLVLKVDDSIQNLYVGDGYDIHGNKVGINTRWLDTFGTESWMAGQIRNGVRDINHPNLVSQVLTGDLVSKETLEKMGIMPGMDTYYDNTDILKLEQMRYGYDAYTSIVTYGNYGGGKIQVIPFYYALKTSDAPLKNNSANEFLKKHEVGEYIPVDVYIDKDGMYAPINLFGNAENSKPNINDINLYDYIFNLDWTSEDNRRNYTMGEKERTLRVRDYFKKIIYDIPESDLDDLINSDNPDYSKYPIKDVLEYDIPKGKYNLLGTPQYILMDSKHRTFIGDRHSYGNEVWNQIDEIPASTYPIDKNIDSVIEDIYFEEAVQRWHGKIGLPSSAVLVPKEIRDSVIKEKYGEDKTISDLNAEQIDEVVRTVVNSDTLEYVMNDNYAIICTAEFISVGDVWTLYYNQPWYRTLSLYGKDLKESEEQGKDVYKSFDYVTNKIGDTTGEHYPGHLVNGKLCPSCIPPILAVYSSSHSSVEDVDIIGTH